MNDSESSLDPIHMRGFSWVLRVTASGATLRWDDPFVWTSSQYSQQIQSATINSIEYATDTWDCAGPNTLTLVTGDADVPTLPKKICIVPVDLPRSGGCNPDIPCEYGTTAERCACCDDCCPCIPATTVVTCGEDEETCSTPFCGPARAMNGTPADGMTRSQICTFFGHSIELVIGCVGGEWVMDVYCDNVYEGPGTFTLLNCCPFSFEYSFPLTCLPDCTGGGGGGGSTTPCCPDAPADLTVTLTSTCPDVNGVSITVSGGSGTWTGGTGLTAILSCDEDVWTLSVTTGICTYYSGVASMSVCDPVEITFPDFEIEELIPGECSCIGLVVSAIVTE